MKESNFIPDQKRDLVSGQEKIRQQKIKKLKSLKEGFFGFAHRSLGDYRRERTDMNNDVYVSDGSTLLMIVNINEREELIPVSAGEYNRSTFNINPTETDKISDYQRIYTPLINSPVPLYCLHQSDYYFSSSLSENKTKALKENPLAYVQQKAVFVYDKNNGGYQIDKNSNKELAYRVHSEEYEDVLRKFRESIILREMTKEEFKNLLISLPETYEEIRNFLVENEKFNSVLLKLDVNLVGSLTHSKTEYIDSILELKKEFLNNPANFFSE